MVVDIEPIRERFSAVAPFLDERGRRLVAAAEAFAAGYGGIAAVAMATGVAPSTIGRGLKELAQDEPSARIRRPGAGRKSTISKDPRLLPDLEALVEPTTRGDPESPLRWTCKSVRRLAQALQAQGHEVSRTLVAHLLNEAGYSLQANRKTTEGDSHPDRDAQFGYINTQVTTALAEKQPVISVDTKKKELVGDFRNNGREYRPQGNPEEVRVHDFLIKELGRAVPYGIYDLAANSGWVSVGVDHDTAAFAVNSIRQWWLTVGRARYPEATRLLITADGGGSNGSRVRLWKRELQKLANELGLDIVVSHLPPGTSKWNKIGVSRTHRQQGRCGAVQEMRVGPSRSAVRCRPQTTASCDRQERWWCCVKKVRERRAVREMKEDPSEPSCRGRLQTAMSCFGQKLR